MSGKTKTIQAMVSDYTNAAIAHIEKQKCEHCKKALWHVLTFLVDGRDLTHEGFYVGCAVQCHKCKTAIAKDWRYNPFGQIIGSEVQS